MTILALAFAAASIAGCIVLGVVVNHQRHTIERALDRIHPEVLRPETCCGACPPIALSNLAHGGTVPCGTAPAPTTPTAPTTRENTMTDQITDQDKRDALAWAGGSQAIGIADAAARVILATVGAPEPTLAEELRDTARWWREGAPTWEQCCDRFESLANRAEQIEQERDAARAEVARTDSARTQNYGDGSTLAGFLQKCVNIAHNIAAEYPSRPVKDHVIDLRRAADYAGRVEQERDEARSEVEHLTAELDQAIAQRSAETASREAAQKSRDEARAEVERLTTEQNTDLFGGAVYATPAGRMSQIQHYTFRPASALPDPADVPEGQAWVVSIDDMEETVGFKSIGFGWICFRELGGTTKMIPSDRITLVSRLVPAQRVITNPDELDRLAEGTIVRDKDGDAWRRTCDEWTTTADYGRFASWAVSRSGPVTVLWEPEA